MLNSTGLLRSVLAVSASGLNSSINTVGGSLVLSKKFDHVDTGRRSLGTGIGSSGGGIEKKIAESLIGLRRDIPDSYTSGDPELYKQAVKNFFAHERGKKRHSTSALCSTTQPSPLFGTIPAMRAASAFLKNELCLRTDEVQIEEHYFQQFVYPLPPRSKVNTIVQLADIVDKGDSAMFIIDTATRDENDVFLTFNQFCYRVKGAGGIGSSKRSSRRVQIMENVCQETQPWIWEQVRVNAAQDSVFSRLLSHEFPMKPLVPQEDCYGLMSPFPPLQHLGTLGSISDVILDNLNIPLSRLKGIKVLRSSKDVLPDDCLNINAWKYNKHLLFFNVFNSTPGRSDWTYSGYITFY